MSPLLRALEILVSGASKPLRRIGYIYNVEIPIIERTCIPMTPSCSRTLAHRQAEFYVPGNGQDDFLAQ